MRDDVKWRFTRTVIAGRRDGKFDMVADIGGVFENFRNRGLEQILVFSDYV